MMLKFALFVVLVLLLVEPQQQRSLCTSGEKINCRERAKADYSNLGEVFATEP